MLKISYVGGDSPEIIFEGEVLASQVKHAFDAVVSGPEFARGKGLVVDARGMKQEYSHDEIRAMANHMAAHRDDLGHRLAIVVSPDSQLQYGLARMFSIYAGMHDLIVAVFSRQNDALCFIAASAEA